MLTALLLLSVTPEFFLMGIHVRPADVVQELEALLPAFQLASEFHGSSRGTILGDLNAGCRLAHTQLHEWTIPLDLFCDLLVVVT